MKKILPLSLFSLIIFNSCALLFMPKKQKVTLSSSDKSSEIYLDGNSQGKKTTTFKTDKDGIKQVMLRTPGHKDSYAVMVPNRRQGGFWACIVGDAIFTPLMYGIYGLFVDPILPKSRAYQKSNKFNVSGKYNVKQENEKYIAITNIGLDLNKDKDLIDLYTTFDQIGGSIKIEKLISDAEAKKIKADTKKAKKKSKKDLENEKNEQDALQFDDTKFSLNLFKTLKSTGYVDTINKIFQDNNNTLFLESKITKIKLYRFNQRNTYNNFYKSKVDLTWYLKNQFDERLDSIKTSEFSGEFVLAKQVKYDDEKAQSQFERMIGDAIDNAYIKISTNSTFKNHIQSEAIKAFTEPELKLGGAQNLVTDKSDASIASVIIKRKDKGHGSGFAISKDGYIITNYHVIASNDPNKQEDLTIVTSDGIELKPTVVRVNKARDIALLKVDHSFNKVFGISNEKKFKNLQDVLTIGAPKSIELGQSVTTGIISNERKSNNNELLQLNMAINFGNSGGPLFDSNGNLHGVIVSKVVGQNTEGIAFAIPAYKIAEYLNITY